jgi:hypothetical protein
MSNGKVAKSDCADLTPPVEKKSQLTLSVQWLLGGTIGWRARSSKVTITPVMVEVPFE